MERIGLIADFDNTFVRTYTFVTDHLIATCRRIQVTAPSKIEILEILKANPKFEKIFETFFAEKWESVLTAYRETAMDTPYKPIDGGHEAVEKLRKAGVQIIIVSNRVNKLSERLAQARYNPEDFAIIQPEFPKPNKAAYKEALEGLAKQGVKRENTYIVGDSLDDFLACPEDLEGHFFAVTTGLNSRDEFLHIKVKEDNILPSITSLPEKIIHNG